MILTIINEYYRAYVANVVLLNRVYPIEFIEASEFIFPKRVMDEDMSVVHDLCLRENTLKEIGKDILENGTYWLTSAEPTGYDIMEGGHRVAGLQLQNPYVSKKLPCVRFSVNVYDTTKFDEPKFYYMPVSILYDTWPSETIPDMVEAEEYTSNRIVKVYADNKFDYVMKIMALAYRLNWYIQTYSRMTDLKFKGSSYLNNEDLFKELINIENFNIMDIKNEYLGGFDEQEFNEMIQNDGND